MSWRTRRVAKEAVASGKDKARAKIIGKFSAVKHPTKSPTELCKSYLSETCKWFLDDDTYSEWLNSQDRPLLLVSAPPGCGKSVLAAHLVEEEFPSRLPGACGIHHFFVQSHETGKLTTAMQAIIHQLLDKNNDLADYVENDVLKFGDSLKDNVTDMMSIFRLCLDSGRAGQVICVLDALDECEAGSLDALVDWLASFSAQLGKDGKAGKAAARIKIVATTQGIPQVLERFEKKLGAEAYYHISADDEKPKSKLQAEVQTVMEARFLDFAKYVGMVEDRPRRDALWKKMEEVSRDQRTLSVAGFGLPGSVYVRSHDRGVDEYHPPTTTDRYGGLRQALPLHSAPTRAPSPGAATLGLRRERHRPHVIADRHSGQRGYEFIFRG